MLRYAEGSESTHPARGRISRGDRRAPGIEVVSANQYGGADVEGAYKKSEALLSRYQARRRQPRRRRHLLPERIDDARDAARAAGQRLGGQGEVHRLRRVRHAGERARRRAHRRPRRCRIRSTWAISASRRWSAHLRGQAVEKRIDTGVRLDHARQHERSRRQGAAAPGPVAMAEAAERGAALRDARRAARRSARPSRSTASISPCAAGEVCALVGQNGAGKSTLMAILAGALTPDAGEHAARRRAVRAARSARGASRRRRDDLSGAVARAAPERDGEHRARRRAGPRRRHRRGATGCARRRSRALARARPSRHRARARRSAICRRRRSSSSRSRARSPSAVACSSSTSRRAAWRTPTCSALFELIGAPEGAGARDRLHLALHRGSEGGVGSLRRAPRRPERGRAASTAAMPARATIVEPDGGPRARRPLPARRARRPASRSSSSTA